MNRVCCFTGYRPHRFDFSPDGLRPEQVQVLRSGHLTPTTRAGNMCTAELLMVLLTVPVLFICIPVQAVDLI